MKYISAIVLALALGAEAFQAPRVMRRPLKLKAATTAPAVEQALQTVRKPSISLINCTAA